MKNIGAWSGRQTKVASPKDGYFILHTEGRKQPYTVFRWGGRHNIKTLFFTHDKAMAQAKVVFEASLRSV